MGKISIISRMIEENHKVYKVFFEFLLNNSRLTLMQRNFKLVESKFINAIMFAMGYRGFFEVVGGLGCPCYLGALMISVIKPSGNTCMA